MLHNSTHLCHRNSSNAVRSDNAAAGGCHCTRKQVTPLALQLKVLMPESMGIVFVDFRKPLTVCNIMTSPAYKVPEAAQFDLQNLRAGTHLGSLVASYLNKGLRLWPSLAKTSALACRRSMNRRLGDGLEFVDYL